MKTKKIILFDGQALDRTKHEYLYQFHNKGEADIFDMYNSTLVSYIEFIQAGILHELYCFPKEYTCIDSANISHAQELIG